MVSLRPAYGRDYKTAREVVKAYLMGVILSMKRPTVHGMVNPVAARILVEN